MTVLSLFPSRIRWTDANGFLTNEAYRALQIVLQRLGGTSTDLSLTGLQQEIDTLVLDDLVDVKITSATANDVLVYGGTLWENKGPVLARDALGLGTGTPTNGQLLIGNGTDFSTSSLTAGNGVSITAGPGALTVAANLTDGAGINIAAVSGALQISTDLVEGAGINITNVSGQLTIATDLVAGTGMSIANVAGQLTLNTSLVAGANISITGSSSLTIAVTGLGSMAFQSTGATGSFLSGDTPAKTVTVSNGIITAIT